MLLEGSCHCGKVRFSVRSQHPVPYQLCYCGICVKTQGGGGYAINIAADAATLRVTGRKFLKIYHARLKQGTARARASAAERVFCGECGSHLWLFSPQWPELLHPVASAIDTALPTAPQRTHMMLGSKPSWVRPEFGRHDRRFDDYPEEAIADWHERLGLISRPV